MLPSRKAGMRYGEVSSLSIATASSAQAIHSGGLRPSAIPCGRHLSSWDSLLIGSLAGAAHLLNDNAGALKQSSA